MLRATTCLVILALGAVIGFATPAQAVKRVALLVGNNNYEAVPRLQTAVNDAHAVGGALRQLGFSVTIVENQSRRALSEAMIAFDKQIEPGDVALFFFAGHGFEIRGQNYLLPTDIPEIREGQEELIRDTAFPADRIVDRLQARGARTVVLVLDACRNNPFEQRGGRGLKGSGGLAMMTPAEGVFIMFSAGAKQTALDKLSQNERAANSVFTRNFVRRLVEPNLTLVQIAKQVQLDVRQMAASVGRDQMPAYYDQIFGDIVLSASGRAVAPAEPPPSTPSSPQLTSLPSAIDKHPLPAAPPSPADPVDPVIAELDALAAARSWSELRNRLTTVKPTARNQHWASLVEQTAIGELTPLAASRDPFADRLSIIEWYFKTFPSLHESPKFLALRASIGLSAFGDCFERVRGQMLADCRRSLESFVRATPKKSDGAPPTDLALEAAHLIGLRVNRAAATPFFAIAMEGLASAGTGVVCADAELTDAVIAALRGPPDWDEAKAAVALTTTCWSTLRSAVVAQLARETGGGYFLNNACPTLLKNNALTGLRAARCREVTPQPTADR